VTYRARYLVVEPKDVCSVMNLGWKIIKKPRKTIGSNRLNDV